MEETLVVDRIEEGIIAVCENRYNQIMIDIELSKLPEGVKEGSVIKYYDGLYRIDDQEENEIKMRIAEKMDDLWTN